MPSFEQITPALERQSIELPSWAFGNSGTRFKVFAQAGVPRDPFGTDAIGKVVVDALRDSNSPAVLVENHGPFTVGANAKAAVKAAVMCEDVCRSVHIARQLGEPKPIAPDDVTSLFNRYQNVYGQR